MLNRDIKFRVWNGHAFKYIQFIPTMGFIFNDFHNAVDFGEDDPQQYTGCKDRDDRDVYEGDILESLTYTSGGKGSRAIVSFNNDNFGGVMGWNLLDLSGEAWEYYYGESPNKYWKIIGNIHENPDLTKELSNDNPTR
jgi:uncharacterized phage protein (TIGR01671 family)